MNYTIEQRPQRQPGACCLTGIHEDEWFLRLNTSDAFHGSLIISRTAFVQLAEELGFVPVGKTDRQIQEIRELQNALDHNLADISVRLSSALTPLLGLQEVLRGFEQLATAVERAAEPIQIIDGGFDELPSSTGSNAPSSESSELDEPAGTSEGSFEPTPEPQLDGIFPVGSKRTPGLPRTAGKN